MGISSCRTDRGRTTVAGDKQLEDGQRKDYGEWDNQLQDGQRKDYGEWG